MTSHSIRRFWQKSWDEKLSTAQFVVRQSLARLPYAPVPVHLRISNEEEMHFWWSYLPPFFDKDRGFFEYWGHDSGDLRLLWKILKPGQTFLDIGAYHGIYSVVAAKRVGAEGHVVAFEPSPRERRRLRLHLRWNGIRCARVECLAIGSGASETSFFQVVSGDPTRSGLRPPATKDSLVKIPVKTISLDQYVSETHLRQVDVMKLDVEGGELEVLQGATMMFNQFRPILICEVLDETTQVWGYKAREIISLLSSWRYLWFEFRADGILIPHEIRDQYPTVKNYVAIPQEKMPLA